MTMTVSLMMLIPALLVIPTGHTHLRSTTILMDAMMHSRMQMTITIASPMRTIYVPPVSPIGRAMRQMIMTKMVVLTKLKTMMTITTVKMILKINGHWMPRPMDWIQMEIHSRTMCIFCTPIYRLTIPWFGHIQTSTSILMTIRRYRTATITTGYGQTNSIRPRPSLLRNRPLLCKINNRSNLCFEGQATFLLNTSRIPLIAISPFLLTEQVIKCMMAV